MPAKLTSHVDEAAAILKRGGLVAFPTETVYGLGADALNAQAVARIFEAKQRPAFDPLIVHVAKLDQLLELAASVPDSARELMDRFWPGPLTLILPKTPAVPDIVTSGLGSVGLRMPDHPIARELLEKTARPIAAPSANLFGRTSPTTARHVMDQLHDRIDGILDGGPCRVGLESTVLDLTTATPTLLRPGAVTLENLEAILGAVDVRTQVAAGENAPAPGLLESHYAPRTPTRLWNPQSAVPLAGRLGLLTVLPVATQYPFAAVEVLSQRGDLAEAAAGLFAAMRRLDDLELDGILAVPGPGTGVGRAINDRLTRSAARRDSA